MEENSKQNSQVTEWFAIRSRDDKRLRQQLDGLCEEVFTPTVSRCRPGKKTLVRAAIPHVFFVKASRVLLLARETDARLHPDVSIPFWIYRYPASDKIQVIPESSVRLLKLITSAADDAQCEIFTKSDFKENEKVRVIGGIYKGYEGYVQRVKKNKHVIVRIEGVCCVMLPFIHPDLLEAAP